VAPDLDNRPRRTKTKAKRQAELDPTRSRRVRDHHRLTVYIHPLVFAELRKLHSFYDVPYNTLVLRGIGLYFESLGNPSILELTGEDPASW